MQGTRKFHGVIQELNVSLGRDGRKNIYYPVIYQ